MIYLNDIQFNSILYFLIVKCDKFQMHMLESDCKDSFLEKYLKISRKFFWMHAF